MCYLMEDNMSNEKLAAKLKQREQEDQMVLEAASELIKAKSDLKD